MSTITGAPSQARRIASTPRYDARTTADAPVPEKAAAETPPGLLCRHVTNRSHPPELGWNTSRSFGMAKVKTFRPPGDLDPYLATNALNRLHPR